VEWAQHGNEARSQALAMPITPPLMLGSRSLHPEAYSEAQRSAAQHSAAQHSAPQPHVLGCSLWG